MWKLTTLILLMFSSTIIHACENINIPNNVKLYISKHKLQYEARKVTVNESYASYMTNWGCHITADFNGDKIQDFAAFLYKVNTGNLVPVVFISKGNTFIHQLISDRAVYKYPQGIFSSLNVLPAGKQRSIGEHITIPNPGIKLHLFEKPCCRFFWSNNKLVEILTDG